MVHDKMNKCLVELTGVEPVSKQGIPMLSTRLSWPSFSSGDKTQATNHRLICYVSCQHSAFSRQFLCAAKETYSVNSCAAISIQPTDSAWSDVSFRCLAPK